MSNNEWTASGAELKQSDDKKTGVMHETFTYDMAAKDPNFDLNTKWVYRNAFALNSGIGNGFESIQASSAWADLVSTKPVVKAPPTPPPVVVPGDKKKAKKKRHSCGKGANYLVMGAATLAASALIL